MRVEGQQESTNVEDRRGRGGRVAVGGGIGAILLVVVFTLLGGDPSKMGDILGGGGGAPGGGTATQEPRSPEEEKLASFVKKVLKTTEDVWTEQLGLKGKAYLLPKLVLFTGAVESACGSASAAVGPFYCPGDQKLYIDLSFYDDLRRKLGAPGDFAQAYVIAHEVGHHIQFILGTSEELDRKRRKLDKVAFNRESVKMELQADFYAGVWAHHAEKKGLLEMGDLEEAMNAASKIGDDHLQKQAQGRVVPDAFTHGTSAQRMAWFRYGYQTGDWTKGDTFDDAVFARVNPR